MLTLRELAAAAYSGAMAQGRGRVLGADSMVDVTDRRLDALQTARRQIARAKGTERYFTREPDDARLEQMLAAVDGLVSTATEDRSRWSAQPLPPQS